VLLYKVHAIVSFAATLTSGSLNAATKLASEQEESVKDLYRKQMTHWAMFKIYSNNQLTYSTMYPVVAIFLVVE
jgi:hypothetical protein